MSTPPRVHLVKPYVITLLLSALTACGGGNGGGGSSDTGSSGGGSNSDPGSNGGGSGGGHQPGTAGGTGTSGGTGISDGTGTTPSGTGTTTTGPGTSSSSGTVTSGGTATPSESLPTDGTGASGGSTSGGTGSTPGTETPPVTGPSAPPSSSSSGGTPPPPAGSTGVITAAAPALKITGSVKQLHFSWPTAAGATYYKLFENVNGTTGFSPLGTDITGTSQDRDIAVHRQNWSTTRYLLDACNSSGCTASNEVLARDASTQAIGYLKPSNTAPGDYFSRTAFSADGNTLAVGAMGKDSQSGAVYVFTRQGSSWSQKALIKAPDAASGDYFGSALALSADGTTLAVGAYLEDSLSVGINGSRGSISENNSNRGAVYVFTRSTDAWTEQAYVKSSGTRSAEYFGKAVALSGNGNTLVVGAIGERTGGMDAGAGYVFTRSAGTWSQQTVLKPATALPGAHFGAAVTINSDGSTLAVGAPDEYNGSDVGGSVYVFVRGAGTWSQLPALKASNTAAFDAFGSAVALSGDGSRLAIGAHEEKSAATGVNGNQADRSASSAGAAYVFTHGASAWSQQAYLKASNTTTNDAFGSALAFSTDGNTLVVGATGESSAATGVGGNQADKTASNAGAAYVFISNNSAWSQQNYVKASKVSANDAFGSSVALSGDGNTLAVGAPGESSSAGAVYLY